jgi:hypothetical protein
MRGIGSVSRLFQQMLIHHNYRIGTEYHIVRLPREDRAGLIARQALRILQWLLLRQGLLCNVRRFYGEWNTRIAQKLGAAWRSGSQDQGHAATILTGGGWERRVVPVNRGIHRKQSLANGVKVPVFIALEAVFIAATVAVLAAIEAGHMLLESKQAS